MKIAVTAASGRLGHAILRHLGADAVAIARSPERVRVPGVPTRAGDYRSVESMRAAFQGVDTAVLISMPIEKGTDRAALHRNAIAAARMAGVGTLVYTSVVGIDTPEETLYRASQAVHRDSEAALRASGTDWVILRNGLYLELDLAHIVKAGPDGVYSNPAGEGRAPYITVDELAFATACVAADAARHRGRQYNITGECVSQAGLVAMANDVFGLRVRFTSVGDEEYLARRTAERGEAVARMLTGCFQCIRRGAFDVSSDYEAAAGRRPKALRVMTETCRKN